MNAESATATTTRVRSSSSSRHPQSSMAARAGSVSWNCSDRRQVVEHHDDGFGPVEEEPEHCRVAVAGVEDDHTAVRARPGEPPQVGDVVDAGLDVAARRSPIPPHRRSTERRLRAMLVMASWGAAPDENLVELQRFRPSAQAKRPAPFPSSASMRVEASGHLLEQGQPVGQGGQPALGVGVTVQGQGLDHLGQAVGDPCGGGGEGPHLGEDPLRLAAGGASPTLDGRARRPACARCTRCAGARTGGARRAR